MQDVKCSANWMWAAKFPADGALLYDACTAMCEVMRQLGIAVDGGKDSLSMTARVNDGIVKAPGLSVRTLCSVVTVLSFSTHRLFSYWFNDVLCKL